MESQAFLSRCNGISKRWLPLMACRPPMPRAAARFQWDVSKEPVCTLQGAPAAQLLGVEQGAGTHPCACHAARRGCTIEKPRCTACSHPPALRGQFGPCRALGALHKPNPHLGALRAAWRNFLVADREVCREMGVNGRAKRTLGMEPLVLVQSRASMCLACLSGL